MEDQDDVVEAMRLDAVDEMTEQLEGTRVGGVDSTDGEKEDDGIERTVCGGAFPRPSAEISSSLISWRGQRGRAALTTPPST